MIKFIVIAYILFGIFTAYVSYKIGKINSKNPNKYGFKGSISKTLVIMLGVILFYPILIIKMYIDKWINDNF